MKPPRYIARCSYGNDSIAMLQLLLEHGLKNVTVTYSDTGWAAEGWEQHVAYETLHPFTDGNGRSGRALWLHRHVHESALDPWAVKRGFLHSWYYHTLSNVRCDSGRHAQRGDANAAPSEGCQSGGATSAASPTPTPPNHPSNREAT